MPAIGTAICGLVTSLLTAVLVVFLSQLFGTEIFTWSVWVIIPIGAILTGALACSGYYFGSRFFNSRPTRALVAQAVVVAGLTQLLIYYLEYFGAGLSDRMSFMQYLPLSLTQGQYSIGHVGTGSGFTVGSFGYVLAGIQFLGFLLGGGVMCAWLFQQPYCDKCSKYFKVLGKRQFKFAKWEELAPFFNALLENVVHESKCLSHLAKDDLITTADPSGAVRLDLALHGCASCGKQLMISTLHVFDGKAWAENFKTPASQKKIDVPAGISLSSAFGKRI